MAANFGNLKAVRFLVNLTDTPNAANNEGKTPIHLAVEHINTCFRILVSESQRKHLQVRIIAFMKTIKFLVGLTDNPMTTEDNDGNTPIDLAQHEGIVNFLKTLTDAPNVSV